MNLWKELPVTDKNRERRPISTVEDVAAALFTSRRRDALPAAMGSRLHYGSLITFYRLVLLGMLWKIKICFFHQCIHWWRSSENTLVGKSMVKGTAPSEASMQNGIAFPFAPTGQRSRFVPPVHWETLCVSCVPEISDSEKCICISGTRNSRNFFVSVHVTGGGFYRKLENDSDQGRFILTFKTWKFCTLET